MKTADKKTIEKHFRLTAAHSDRFIEEDFEDLVFRASDGDRGAINAIAGSLGTLLRCEAQVTLRNPGGSCKAEAEQVFQEFLNVMLEARDLFNAEVCSAMEWLTSTVRMIAAQKRRERKQRRKASASSPKRAPTSLPVIRATPDEPPQAAWRVRNKSVAVVTNGSPSRPPRLTQGGSGGARVA